MTHRELISRIFKAAWTMARRDAIAEGKAVRAVFGDALRMAWAQAKDYLVRKAGEAHKAAVDAARKSIVKILDYAAGRTVNGATKAQTWYLAGLMAEAGHGAEKYRSDAHPMSKSTASRLIDQYRAAAA